MHGAPTLCQVPAPLQMMGWLPLHDTVPERQPASEASAPPESLIVASKPASPPLLDPEPLPLLDPELLPLLDPELLPLLDPGPALSFDPEQLATSPTGIERKRLPKNLVRRMTCPLPAISADRLKVTEFETLGHRFGASHPPPHRVERRPARSPSPALFERRAESRNNDDLLCLAAVAVIVARGWRRRSPPAAPGSVDLHVSAHVVRSMSTAKTRKTKTPSPDTQNAEAAPPAASQEPEASAKPAKSEKGSRPGVRVVSVGFPSRTARQLKLISSISGESIASIVISAVTRVIAKRLPDALAEIAKADSDPDAE